MARPQAVGFFHFHVPDIDFAFMQTHQQQSRFHPKVFSEEIVHESDSNINPLREIKMCEGPDLNRGTPARTDLESVAFDRAWLPSLRGFR